jgi:hypothetical protein
MSLKKVAKGHEKLLSVSDATLAKSLLNVVDNHSSDFSATIRPFQEIISQAQAATSGMCSCSPIAATSSSLRPLKAMQSSKEIIGPSYQASYR